MAIRLHSIVRTVVLACLGWMSCLSGALAADGQGTYVVRGLGAQPCSEYVKAVQGGQNSSHDYLVWLEGYLSAINKLTPDTFESLPVVAIGHTGSIIYGSCVKQPKVRLELVVDAVLRSFFPYRVKADSQLVEV